MLIKMNAKSLLGLRPFLITPQGHPVLMGCVVQDISDPRCRHPLLPQLLSSLTLQQGRACATAVVAIPKDHFYTPKSLVNHTSKGQFYLV